MGVSPKDPLQKLEYAQLPHQWRVPLVHSESPIIEQYTGGSGAYVHEYGPGHTPKEKNSYPAPAGEGTPIQLEAASIQSSGSTLVDNAERLFNNTVGKASQTATLIKDAVHGILDNPQGPYDPSLGAALLAGAAWIGARRTYGKIQNWVRANIPDDDFNDFGDKRERLSRQLVLRKRGTVDEILKASFGEWPPKGLDIYGKNSQEVVIKNAIPREEPTKPWQLRQKVKNILSGPFGSASLNLERDIKINTSLTAIFPAIIKKSAIANTLGHEGVHILQGDHGFRSADFLGEDAYKILRRMNAFTERTLRTFQIPEENFVVKQQEYMSAKLANRKAYLRDGVEIQARLHEILADGYQRWGILPQNKEQLTAAMANAGLIVPEKILTDLISSPTIAETRSIFVKDHTKPELIMAVHDINSVYSDLTEKGQDHFWNSFIPMLYSDLIEMYGDKLGRERFGYGQNLYHQFRLHAAGQPSAVPEMLKNLPTDIPIEQGAGDLKPAATEIISSATSRQKPPTFSLPR